MKNTENFPSSKIFWKPSRATIKSTLYADSKDEWNTKEGTGKSMKNVLYCGMPKSTFWVEVKSNSEKNQACSHCQVNWSEGIRQLVS